jgi:3-deoxy-D-manno-octulosonate 8-phosphate phosphatase (KDO 8-P phosphatase)
MPKSPSGKSPSSKSSAAARARKIKLILFDVDGVLTDGKIWIFPAPAGTASDSAVPGSLLQRSASSVDRETSIEARSIEAALDRLAANAPTSDLDDRPGFGFRSTTLIEAKGFNAHDGTGISLARLAGIKTGLITKRLSETVALRARDLRMEHVHQGIQHKAVVLEEILAKETITAAEVAFVGDDIIDLPVMRRCGLAIAVKNARPEVKAEAHWITPHSGGDGAARDAIEFILKAQGKWKQSAEAYILERS